jgi:hemerythrin-like domain-containing protein
MSAWSVNSRRRFLRGTMAIGGMALSACSGNPENPTKKESPAVKKDKGEEEVSPAEDLMREHGVLKRILLIYGEGIRRIDAAQDLPPDALTTSANLIRRFIEDYHEKLEEEYLFPRFRKAGSLLDLVDVLEAQHKRGRSLTETILRLTSSTALKNAQDKQQLKEALQRFVRMYEPHEAREDTVLFPAFRKIVSDHEYGALGEDFERKERELFGEDGFEKNVDEVRKIESALGIYDLAKFTPPE